MSPVTPASDGSSPFYGPGWTLWVNGFVFVAEVTGDAGRFASVPAVGANVPPNGDGIRAVQTYLRDLYIARSSGFGMGISASPNLHVAMVTRCTSRPWG